MKRFFLILCLLLTFISVTPAQIQRTEQIGQVNSQTGTTYTFVFSDRGKLVTFNNGSSVAGTLPQATAAGSFRSGWTTFVYNLGAGTVTITPTTSTINGGASIALAQNEGATIFSNGTNYLALRTLTAAAGGGITTSGSPASPQIARFSSGTQITTATATDLSTPLFCSDAGANDSYACSLSPAIASYVAGTHYRFKANTANTGAATINFNSIGAKTIKKQHDQDLADNDIEAGSWVDVVYDGSADVMQMQSQIANSAAGGVTASSTDTFTNKTIDAEGTGNVLTIPAKIYFAAAGCSNTTAASFFDLPTSTPAVAACVTGTNTQKGVLQFADTSGGFSAQTNMLLPDDWTGNIDVKLIWRTSATTGNVKWSVSTISTATNATETDDPAFNTASTVTTAVAGTANRLQTSSITSITITGVAAGEYLHFKVFRDGNDASDTAGATVELIGMEVTIRRAI